MVWGLPDPWKTVILCLFGWHFVLSAILVARDLIKGKKEQYEREENGFGDS